MESPRIQAVAAAALLAALSAPPNVDALDIIPNYIGGAATWGSIGSNNADGRVTFDAAIAHWESILLDDFTIMVDVEYTDIASAGRWQGSTGAIPIGSDFGDASSPLVNHTITIDSTPDMGASEQYFDQDPGTVGDLPFADIDAYSIILHEIGHMLGFTDFYVLDFANPGEHSLWAGPDYGGHLRPRRPERRDAAG